MKVYVLTLNADDEDGGYVASIHATAEGARRAAELAADEAGRSAEALQARFLANPPAVFRTHWKPPTPEERGRRVRELTLRGCDIKEWEVGE